MIDKNQKKEENKKRRNLWNINPRTRVVPNRSYNRFRDRKNKKVYENDYRDSM